MRLTLLFALVLGTACGAKPKKTSSPSPGAASESGVRQRDATTEVVTGPLAEAILHLRRVHFGFDGFTLEAAARDSLAEAAAILVKHPRVQIRVMGHADERGSDEYNIALGERRARAVIDYLARLGVSRDRLDVISYGELRPLDSRSDSSAYALNRRVDFALLRGDVRLVIDEGDVVVSGDPLLRSAP